MSRGQGPFPINPTAPFVESDGLVIVTADVKAMRMKAGLTYMCRTSTGAITLRLPPRGRVKVMDLDGSSTTNNITVVPPKGHYIMDGAVDENFAIDMPFRGFVFEKAPQFTTSTGIIKNQWGVS